MSGATVAGVGNVFLESALAYRALGLHPIPCGVKSKKALVEWKRYQAIQPSEPEIRTWWMANPSANVALVLGRGMFVMDLDGPGAESLLTAVGIVLPTAAPQVRTGNGKHVYLAASGAVQNRTALLSANGTKPQVDVKGDAGYVLAPPSVHPSGARYVWIHPLRLPLPAPPDALVRLLAESPTVRVVPPADAPHWVAAALRGVTEGERNATCTKLAGYFLNRGMAIAVVQALLEEWANRCVPPLPFHEIRQTILSVARREGRRRDVDQDTAPCEAPEPETGDASERPLVQHVSESLRALMDSADAPPTPVRTPFPSLNRLCSGGFAKGELIYLGARPGVGKTAMAIEFARAAAKCGRTVLMISREMLAVAIARRMVAQEGHLRASGLRSGDRSEWDQVVSTVARLYELPIWLSDTVRSVRQIEQACDQLPHAPELLIVDYLQLVAAPEMVKERRLQVESVSQGLKALALQRAIPVVCLSSLSRPAEGKDKRPTLASLRESGALEHDADIVLLLHREFGSEQTDCVVAKNRDGETGTAKLLFRSEWVSFHEIEHDEPPRRWPREPGED